MLMMTIVIILLFIMIAIMTMMMIKITFRIDTIITLLLWSASIADDNDSFFNVESGFCCS